MLVGGLTDKRNAHIKKTEGIVCIQYVCIYPDMYLFISPFISNGNPDTDRTYQSSLVHLVEVLFCRWKNIDMQSEPMPSHPRTN